MSSFVARAATLDTGNTLGARSNETPIVAALKAGSEQAYGWLVAQYHAPIYNLVYRTLSDPADAADTTQEIFIKVFRGIRRFDGRCSLKTWIYRIAVNEISNQRRWWFRHKAREQSMEPRDGLGGLDAIGEALQDRLPWEGASPFDTMQLQQVRARVTEELQRVREPYRTTVILRDIEDLSYSEIADVMQTSEATVRSRISRGRNLLKQRLEPYFQADGRAVYQPS